MTYPTATSWKKSSYSGNGGDCVEVRFNGEAVFIRDSKYQGDPAAQPIITLTTTDWANFLHAVKTGAATAVPTTSKDKRGYVSLENAGTVLTYTPAEWAAFTTGVHDHEFDRPALAA